ncbi:MAG: 2-amino-4-hydroxy-6-hydroxymethyldihydropteridine diphosphokinase [Anaerolineaceae bacterium]|nr:2-amino-4-hydroxy-6-hydroxymethyldihydropteridine diphosphokinase [Anaerolineaceae bacterium]
MNDSTRPEESHLAYLSIGSNIHPQQNVARAVELLREHSPGLQLSAAYETTAVDSPGPNFINLAVCLPTSLDAAQLKQQVLAPIENQLGRMRTADKNAPRTIDLDIIIFDGEVVDGELWKRFYLAAPLAEILPGLKNPQTGESLRETAQRLRVE